METILKDTVEAIKNAGEIIRGYYQSEYEVKQKGIGNPVTEADLETDTYLKIILLKNIRIMDGFLRKQEILLRD